MGGSYSVNLPIGGTATIDTKIPMPLTPDGFQQIYVFLDPTNLIDEWNEGNNIDSAQIFSGHWMTLKGTKFNDLNGNGLREENEPGIYGWKIKLDGEQTHSTDSSGNY